MKCYFVLGEFHGHADKVWYCRWVFITSWEDSYSNTHSMKDIIIAVFVYRPASLHTHARMLQANMKTLYIKLLPTRNQPKSLCQESRVANIIVITAVSP